MSRWSIPLALSCSGLITASALATEITPYIINGTNANQSDWPYITALVKKNQDAYTGQFCGGSLIKDRYVLTAAHCVDDLVAEDFDVIVGINNLNNSQFEGARVSVKSVFIIPNYNSVTLSNDIAVLELSRAITSNEATPVTLADSGTRQATSDGASLKVAGWGSTTPDYGNHTKPNILQEVTLPLVNQAICSQTMNGAQTVHSSVNTSNFCAGTPSEGFDSCRGDSGGPIIVENTGVQLGLVSWGATRCGGQGTYGVYTNLSEYRSWIDRNTAGLSYVLYEDKGFLDLGTHNHTFEFTNYGSEPFHFSRNAWAYSHSIETADVINNTCLSKGTLLANESCSMTIRFNLQSYGTKKFYTQVPYAKGSDSNYGLSQTLVVEAAIPGEPSIASILSLASVNVYTDDKPWTIYGSNGVRSAAIGPSQQSTLILGSISPGIYEFDVRLSTHESDSLFLYVNGESMGKVTGERTFTHKLTLTRSSNRIKFVYSKDSTLDAGEDAVYISNFRTTSTTTSTTPATSSGGGGGGSLGWLSIGLLALVARRRK